jgi:hypothetical protein
MKAKLSEIAEAIDFVSEDSLSLLNIKTGVLHLFQNKYLSAAEEDENLSDFVDWEQEEILRAKQYLQNQSDYIELPSKFDFNEYRLIENFIIEVPNEKQKEVLFNAIRGKGAFSRFRQGIERFDLLGKWYEYKDIALTEFAKNWCQENKIEFE